MILFYSFRTIFTETSSSGLIFESIKALEIKMSTVSNLVFASNTILSCFFFFFVTIDLYFLIPAIIMKVVIVAVEPEIPTGLPTKEEKLEMETHPVTVGVKLSNDQHNLKPDKSFCAFYLSIHFSLFLQ